MELFNLAKMLFTSKPSDFNHMEIVRMKHYPFKGYAAMSWCGRIIIREDYKRTVRDSTIRHENIHLLQAKNEGSWWKFYLKYLWYWIVGRPFWKGSSAYYTIPYEMEAYGNQDKLEYTCTKETMNHYKKIKRRREDYINNKHNWPEFCSKL